ncbi:MAG: transporter [Campylobacterales bacterium]
MRNVTLITLLCPLVWAHHGVASLGPASLEGPGAPVETSTSATLPEGSLLALMKLDYNSFETYTPADDREGKSNAYWMYGLGYGATPWLSLYGFLPYTVKKDESNSANTAGFTDISLMAVLGFKYDEGFKLTPASESLDEMADWHFTLYIGGTLPTGTPNVYQNGQLNTDMALGFGKPSWIVGATATKMIGERLTSTTEFSLINFLPYTFEDQSTIEYGSEQRLSEALSWRAITWPEKKFRLDLVGEANYLKLERDIENGTPAVATGGQILYGLLGVRLFKDSSSFALGLKKPFWTNLNEEDQQQGAEGKERYRLIVTFSTIF